MFYLFFQIEGVTKLPDEAESSNPEPEIKADTLQSESANIDEKVFAVPEEKKLSNGGSDFNLPPTPAPSDNGSEISRDTTSPLRLKANKIKSPIKRKGGSGFKCRCGAKKCRDYFYYN